MNSDKVRYVPPVIPKDINSYKEWNAFQIEQAKKEQDKINKTIETLAAIEKGAFPVRYVAGVQTTDQYMGSQQAYDDMHKAADRMAAINAINASFDRTEGQKDMTTIVNTLRDQAAKMLQRAAEAEAEARRKADEKLWEPERTDDPENCPVIYWTNQFEEQPARVEHYNHQRDTWMPCQLVDDDGTLDRCQARLHRDAPARMSKVYTYAAIRSVNGLWYSTKLHNGSGTSWGNLVERFPQLAKGEFWVAAEWVRPTRQEM